MTQVFPWPVLGEDSRFGRRKYTHSCLVRNVTHAPCLLRTQACSALRTAGSRARTARLFVTDTAVADGAAMVDLRGDEEVILLVVRCHSGSGIVILVGCLL